MKMDEDPCDEKLLIQQGLGFHSRKLLLSLSSFGGSMHIFHAACVGQAPFPGFRA